MKRILRDPMTVAMFLAPALVIYLCIKVGPMAWSLDYIFYSGSPITGFKWVGLDNIAKIAFDPGFQRSFWLGIKYSFFVTVFQVGIGLLLALAYLLYLKKTSVLVRTIAFIPMILPTVAVSQMFVKLLEVTPQLGLVNAMLSGLGMPELVQAWLARPASAFWVIVIMDVWRHIGFYAILIYAGLVEIPQHLIEAARVDGARGYRLVRHIIMPLLTPIMAATLVFSLNSTLKVFDSIMSLTYGGPGTSTSPLTIYMHKVAFGYGDYGYGAAVATALTIQCLAVSLLVLWQSRRKEG